MSVSRPLVAHRPFSRDFVLALPQPSHLRLHRVQSGSAQRTGRVVGVTTLTAPVTCVEWSPAPLLSSDSGGEQLMCAAGLTTGKVLLVSLAQSTILRAFASKQLRRCNALAWNSTHRHMLAAGFDKTRADFSVIIWDAESRAPQQRVRDAEVRQKIVPIRRLQREETSVALAWLPDQPSVLLSGTGSRWLRVFDVRAPDHTARNGVHAIIAHVGAVHGVCVDPHNPHVIATYGSEDQTVKLWDTRKLSSNPSSTAGTGSGTSYAAEASGAASSQAPTNSEEGAGGVGTGGAAGGAAVQSSGDADAALLLSFSTRSASRLLGIAWSPFVPGELVTTGEDESWITIWDVRRSSSSRSDHLRRRREPMPSMASADAAYNALPSRSRIISARTVANAGAAAQPTQQQQQQHTSNLRLLLASKQQQQASERNVGAIDQDERRGVKLSPSEVRPSKSASSSSSSPSVPFRRRHCREPLVGISWQGTASGARTKGASAAPCLVGVTQDGQLESVATVITMPIAVSPISELVTGAGARAATTKGRQASALRFSRTTLYSRNDPSIAMRALARAGYSLDVGHNRKVFHDRLVRVMRRRSGGERQWRQDGLGREREAGQANASLSQVWAWVELARSALPRDLVARKEGDSQLSSAAERLKRRGGGGGRSGGGNSGAMGVVQDVVLGVINGAVLPLARAARSPSSAASAATSALPLPLSTPTVDDGNETVRRALGGIEVYDSLRRRQILWVCGWGGGGGGGGGSSGNSGLVEGETHDDDAITSAVDILRLLELRELAGRALDRFDCARIERAVSLAVFGRDIRTAVAILRKCTATLMSSSASAESSVSAQPEAALLNLVAMSLAGFPSRSNSSSDEAGEIEGEAVAMTELWKEMCRALLPQLEDGHPYLCAACAFLCNSTFDALSVLGNGRFGGTSSGTGRVALVDCVAFAASFLPWGEFVEYTEDCAAQCVAEGGIEGLALTGLDAAGFRLLQAAVDRTGDVQSAALISAIALGDHAAAGGLRPFDDGGVVGGVGGGWVNPSAVKDASGQLPNRWRHQQTQWMGIYCQLLDRWSLWEQRAQLDAEIARFASRSSALAGAKIPASARATPSSSARRGVTPGRAAAVAAAAAAKQSGAAAAATARGDSAVAAVCMHAMCSFCGSNLSLPHLLRHHGDSGAAAHGQKVPGVVSGCASCQKSLPRCSVCLLPMRILNPQLEKAYQLRRLQRQRLSQGRNAGANKGSAAAQAADSPTLTAGTMPFRSWWAWCQLCKHGGHSGHMHDWFSTHAECPVSGCDCQCMSRDRRN